MVRIIAGIIVGFLAWSFIWVGSEKLLSALSPGWLGAHQQSFENAVNSGGTFTADTTILLMNIVRGSIVSIISGFIAALVAGERKVTTMILSALLVLFGLFVVVMSWNYVPLWYHVIFTLLLTPMTMLGGSLAKKNSLS